MSEYTPEPEHHNRWVYWGAWIVLGVFIVIGLVTFNAARESRQASDKADEFLAALEDAGVQRLPSKDQVVRILGDDGGATCDDPGNALRKATLYTMMSNGASGPGMRPIVADERVVRGQLAVIQVYCPDVLEDFKSYVSDLKYDEVVNQ